MEKMVENNYLKAGIGVILLSAFTHTVLLIIYSLMNLDFTVINFFKILDLDLFLPQLTVGLPNFIWSYLFIGVEYLVILLLLKKK